MKASLVIASFLLLLTTAAARATGMPNDPEVVHFQSGNLTLGGEIFKPNGDGPFPAVLYNHGSAPGMLNSQASKIIGPLFAAKGWVFFMPYRRGQGLSAKAGPFIGDQMSQARATGGAREAAATMTRLLATDHLQDQMAALQWLRSQKFVLANQVATAGNSFGGIEVVLGSAQASYCAAVDASGGAESWETAPDLQVLMKAAVRSAKSPIFFFQAENDFDLSPSRVLSAEMKRAGKESQLKVYPPYGNSRPDGHSFAYLGAATWFGDVFAFVQKNCMP